MVAPNSNDVLIEPTQFLEKKLGYTDFVNIGSQRWANVVSVVHDESIEIKIELDRTIVGLNNRPPFQGFQTISILDADDTILTRNFINEKSSSIATTVTPKSKILKGENVAFKILLASTLSPTPKTRSTYRKASSAEIACPLRKTPGSPHSVPVTPVNYTLESNGKTVMDRNFEDHNESAESVSPSPTPETSSRHNSPPPVVESFRSATLTEMPPDIHFYHFDQDKGLRVIRTHRNKLSNFHGPPQLLQYVDKCKAAKEELMFSTVSQVTGAQWAPVIVDVSGFEYDAIRRLVEQTSLGASSVF
ncbi:hypothetical protein EC991_010815 [Linnemannia zychae]|nr:hypothetical protein EC991_010815 [Linnemannia zychae]